MPSEKEWAGGSEKGETVFMKRNTVSTRNTEQYNSMEVEVNKTRKELLIAMRKFKFDSTQDL